MADEFEQRIAKLTRTYLNDSTKRLSDVGMGDLMAMRVVLAENIIKDSRTALDAYSCGEPIGEMAQMGFEADLNRLEEHIGEMIGLKEQIDSELSSRVKHGVWKCVPTRAERLAKYANCDATEADIY